MLIIAYIFLMQNHIFIFFCYVYMMHTYINVNIIFYQFYFPRFHSSMAPYLCRTLWLW